MTSFHIFKEIFFLFIVLVQVFTVFTSSSYYTAGVVEFRPNIFAKNSAEILADHIRTYVDIIRSEEANLTDIIVFPESTLNDFQTLTFVPAPSDEVIPCFQKLNSSNNNLYAEFLVQLSCTAQDVRKYVVINLTEKENCSTIFSDPRPCAATGLNIYNTNVVFDRYGRIISRYRKFNLYVEPKNTTFEPEYGIFDTDFGVRFGHFICFDMLFYTPAQELVTKYGIKDIIFPTFFFSELPFLTAVQLQQAWAWGNNVNLLAAGASSPEGGSTGTGIYAGNAGPIVSVMTSGAGIRKLYVARVPIFDSSSTNHGVGRTIPKLQNQNVDPSGIKLKKDPQIGVYNSEQLHIDTKSEISRILCYERHCCHFHLSTSLKSVGNDSRHYKYRIGVFDGKRFYDEGERSDIKVCALYTCTNDDVNSCGEVFEGSKDEDFNVIFESIEIHGEFEKVDEMLLMPSSLTDQLYSLSTDFVLWNTTDKGSHIDVNFQLIAPYTGIRTFGIYAQYFKQSGAIKIYGFFLTALFIAVFVHTIF